MAPDKRAKAKGLMFDPVERSHGEAVDAAIDAVIGTSHRAISRAFISSLGSSPDLRSAMGSYAVGRHMKGPCCKKSGHAGKSASDFQRYF